jgi:hypothetical protein
MLKLEKIISGFISLFVTYKLNYVRLVSIAQMFHGKQKFLFL